MYLINREDKVFYPYFYKYSKGNDDAFESVLNILKIYFNVIKSTFIKYSPIKHGDGSYYRHG